MNVISALSFVIPAKAGIQRAHPSSGDHQSPLDSRFRGNDEIVDSRLLGNGKVVNCRLRRNDDGELIHAQATMRLSVGKRQERHFVRGRYQRSCWPHLAASDTCRRGLQPSVRRYATGVVRIAFDDGIGNPARKAPQKVEQGVEARTDRKGESLMAGFVAGYYGAGAGLRRGPCSARVFLSSFPRKRESRGRIRLSAMTQAHWIPAFAGMTREWISIFAGIAKGEAGMTNRKAT